MPQFTTTPKTDLQIWKFFKSKKAQQLAKEFLHKHDLDENTSVLWESSEFDDEYIEPKTAYGLGFSVHQGTLCQFVRYASEIDDDVPTMTAEELFESGDIMRFRCDQGSYLQEWWDWRMTPEKHREGYEYREREKAIMALEAREIAHGRSR